MLIYPKMAKRKNLRALASLCGNTGGESSAGSSLTIKGMGDSWSVGGFTDGSDGWSVSGMTGFVD